MFSEKKPEPALKRLAPALLLGLLALGALGILLYPMLRPETGATVGAAGFSEAGSSVARRERGAGSGLDLVKPGAGMKADPPRAPAKAPRLTAHHPTELRRAPEARVR